MFISRYYTIYTICAFSLLFAGPVAAQEQSVTDNKQVLNEQSQQDKVGNKAATTTDSDNKLVSDIATAQDETASDEYQVKATNSYWEAKDIDAEFYDSPYQISLFSGQHGEDSERLWSQTQSMFLYGVGVAGALAIMPSSVTGWEKDGDTNLFETWWENVKAGPVWDRDVKVINLIGHPYFGGVYYQAARKSGYRQWDAFFYSFMMSTFYWEYGLEAFAEIPSIQDLVVTPVLGWAYGEWAFNQEREIIEQGGTVWGSAGLGSTALFFLDPVDSVGRGLNSLLGRDFIKAGTGYFTYHEVPTDGGSGSDKQFQLQVKLLFGFDHNPAQKGMSRQRSKFYQDSQSHDQDPVGSSIVGISLGAGYTNLDSKWDVENSYYPSASLGLYFTRSFSTRLMYQRTILNKKSSSQTVEYENYSIDSQYYFNGQGNWRPYVTAGFGEMMADLDRNRKTFLINGGVGLHYKLNNNWALQGDWRHFYSTKLYTNEQHLGAAVVYRFGQGEGRL